MTELKSPERTQSTNVNIYKGLFNSLLDEFKDLPFLPFLLALKVLEKSKPSIKFPKPIKFMIMHLFTNPVKFVLEKFKAKFVFESDPENLLKAIPLLEKDGVHVIEELLVNKSSTEIDKSIENFVNCCLTGKVYEGQDY